MTFSTVAVPAGRAITELSQKTGVPLLASREIGDEILLIQVQDAPLADVMKRIAETTSGRWKDENGTQVLVADDALRAQQVREARQKRIENIQKSIKSSLDQQKKAKAEIGRMNFRASNAQFGRGMSSGGGVEEILWSVIPRLPVGVLADIPEDGRIVYSTSPTSMQRMIPTVDRKLVEEAIKKHNAFVDQMNQHQPDNDMEIKMMESMEKMGMSFKPKKINSFPAKILLVVERGGFLEGLNVEIKAYSADGQTILSEQDTLVDGPGFMSEAMAAVGVAEETATEEKKKQEPAKPAGKAIEFSKTTKQLLTVMQGSMRGSMGELSDEVRALLLRPDMHDPLSFVTSESLMFIAKDKKVNLVADVPDSISGFAFWIQPESYTVESYLENISADNEVEYELKDGWLVLKPENPVKSRRERTDRTALAKFLMAVNGKETITLDDMGEYALKAEPPMESQITMPYVMAFAPSLMGSGFGMLDWDILRFYGAGTANTKQTIKNGGRIPIGSLNNAQTALLNKMVYGADPHLQIRQPNKPAEEPSFFQRMMAMSMNEEKDYRQEPTESLPNGLPRDGFLESKVTPDFALKVGGAAAKTMGMNGTLGTEELAMYRFFMESPMAAQMGGDMPQIQELKVGTRKIIDLEFVLTPAVYLSQKLNEDSMENAKVVKMDALPADLKAKMDKYVADMKKMNLPFFDPSFFQRQDPPSR